MSKTFREAVTAVSAAAAVSASLALPSPAQSLRPAAHAAPAQHVLLVSVDGMHQSDLAWYVQQHPHSALAALEHRSIQYTHAATSNPSDSDPGGTALVTGGSPRSTGVYYDVEYSHKVDEAGAKCRPGKRATGGDVVYDSPDDALPNVPDLIKGSTSTFPSFDENGTVYPGGVDKKPSRIMNLVNGASSLDPATFPVDPATCKPIAPWDYLGDNSIFQVIHQAGRRTAWSDKHAVYLSFNGPGSKAKSIDDFFGPEIDSQAVMPNGKPYPQDDDWAHIEAATQQYDGYKVAAVLHELDGRDHSGAKRVGVPAVLGMNFQVVSVAQKAKSTPAHLIGPDKNGNYTTSAPQRGGYVRVNGRLVPGPVGASALDYVNNQVARMVSEVRTQGLQASTTIILTAKHGQSPVDTSRRVNVLDGPIIDAINAAWHKTHPHNAKLIVAGTDDDLWQSYLSDNSQVACQFVANYLWGHTAQGVNDTGRTVTLKHSGLSKVWAGRQVARFFGTSTRDGRYPDVFGKVQAGVIYSKPSKLAEHGGMNPADRHVLMLVSGAGVKRPRVLSSPVTTMQVAPTVLRLLGLDPRALRAVRVEGTAVLPGLR